MNRFKMNFNNYGMAAPMPAAYYGVGASVGTIRSAAPMPTALNASMIDRVHKAKPGCSACGKKVM